MTTPFIEANAILEMQQGNFDEVRRLLASLFPNERKELAVAASNLAELCFPDSCDVCSGLPVEVQIRYHWVCSPTTRGWVPMTTSSSVAKETHGNH